MAERITVVKFGGIVLPNVAVIRRGRGALGDIGRTAGGLERSDMVRAWRTWDIATAPGGAPAAIVEALERHCDLMMWGYDDWWCLDMGTEVSTRARIDADSWSSEIVLGRPDRRIVSFTVMEQ